MCSYYMTETEYQILKMKDPSRWRRRGYIKRLTLIGLIGCCSLVPSGDPGISSYEILSMALLFLGIILYLCNSSGSRHTPWSIIVFALAVVWTPVSIFNQGLFFYGRNITGPVFFLGCLLLGSRVPEDERGPVCLLLTALATVGILRDYVAAVTGLNISTAEPSRWTFGSLAVALALSDYPKILVALTAPYLFTGKPKLFILGLCFFLLSFFGGAIMAAGRGQTVLMLLCLPLAARTKVQRIILVAGMAILGLALSLGLWQEFGGIAARNRWTSTVWSRFDVLDRDLSRYDPVTRTSQMIYAFNTIKKANLADMMVGFPPRVAQNVRGTWIHNAYLDAALRYGLPCAVLIIVFWIATFIWAVKKLITADTEPLWVSKAVLVTIVVFVSSLLGGLMPWRSAVIPAIVLGMFWAYCTSKTRILSSRVLNRL